MPVLMWAATALIIWGRYIRAMALTATGHLVVFDRYIYDAVAPHGSPLSPAQQLARRASGHLCPGPDLVLLLDAPGAVMYERKHEYDAATLEHWRQRFLSLRARVPQLIVLDATTPAERVRVAATQALWAKYKARWSARPSREKWDQ